MPGNWNHPSVIGSQSFEDKVMHCMDWNPFSAATASFSARGTAHEADATSWRLFFEPSVVSFQSQPGTWFWGSLKHPLWFQFDTLSVPFSDGDELPCHLDDFYLMDRWFNQQQRRWLDVIVLSGWVPLLRILCLAHRHSLHLVRWKTGQRSLGAKNAF